MFTGIIENLGEIEEIVQKNSNYHITINSPISKELKIDQSVAHDGVCLTVVACDSNSHTVTAIEETLQKTNLREWSVGDKINLERCMIMGGRLDGHIVQGHVDTTGICTSVVDADGSWYYRFSYPKEFDGLVISKGSIAVNGTSLTVVDPVEGEFSVAIIPYTYEHTKFHMLKPGSTVNLEFDILGKYVLKNLSNRNSI